MIYEFYSERLTKREGEVVDVYQYDVIPERLRIQLQQIISEAIGKYYKYNGNEFSGINENNKAWDFIRKTICREIGVHSLTGLDNPKRDVIGYIGQAEPHRVVDVVELCFKYIEKILIELPSYELEKKGIEENPKDALEEINYRFRASSIGYQFRDGCAFRVDTEYCYEEIVKPALKILSGDGFEGARDEFLDAHRHYRSGEHGQAIILAGRAFESTLKIICEKRSWNYDHGARASDLLKVIRSNGLWSDYLDKSIDQLLATLASALPKVRDEEGAHGQGRIVKNIPSYLVAYAINLAAAKITMISEAEANTR